MSGIRDRRGSPRRQFPARRPIDIRAVLLICLVLAGSTVVLAVLALATLAGLLE